LSQTEISFIDVETRVDFTTDGDILEVWIEENDRNWDYKAAYLRGGDIRKLRDFLNENIKDELI